MLLVGEDAHGNVKGCAIALHAADLNFVFLDLLATAPARGGAGVGGAVYERIREEAAALQAVGVFFECLPDDPALSTDPKIRRQNEARLRFYETFGARPLAGTAYETPISANSDNPPYLVFDDLGSAVALGRRQTQAIMRAILERKYGSACPPAYVDMVVKSVRTDPVPLRPFRYRRRPVARRSHPASRESMPMVVNDKHDIHHMSDRGYVEAPVRISAILREIDQAAPIRRLSPRRFSETHIRAVHDSDFVDYLRRACAAVPTKKSIYPYVFPIRNNTRPPKSLPLRAGYFCIDTFTPLNQNAWLAARRAVDCTLTAAEQLLSGARVAYALVRPPGHHAERRAFGGFCYFNNAAIAAQYLCRYGSVAVLDVDYHHGNGTQDIFWRRSDVLTVSIHGHPSFAYPYFSGFREEIGEDRGRGYNLNIPLDETIGTEDYFAALKIAIRRVRKFKPTHLVLALGLDTAKSDPTGSWPLVGRDFEQLGRAVARIGLPTLVVQEGGYRTRTLGYNARRFFTGLWQASAQDDT
jgi:acetoin utilization deacetylase AcuC-like enzyme